MPRNWLNVVLPPNKKLDLDPSTPGGEKALTERAEKKGMVMVLLYAQIGSMQAVADLLECNVATVRHWLAKMRAQKPDKIFKIADRLRGDIAQLAADRVQEGLLEGDTQFAADLGRKVLHGLGELNTHNLRTPATGGMPTSLNITFAAAPQTPALPERQIEILEGTVLGRPRDLEEVAREEKKAKADED
jgi:hypothetical protein